MPNQQIAQALENYTGEQETLDAFVAVAVQELGENWTENIFQVMEGLPDNLQERLEHAFNYYAALTAWDELQSYLNQQTPLDYGAVTERLPILEHWLSFFGSAGSEAVAQLKEHLRHVAEQSHYNTTALDNPFAEPVVQTGEAPASNVSATETMPIINPMSATATTPGEEVPLNDDIKNIFNITSDGTTSDTDIAQQQIETPQMPLQEMPVSSDAQKMTASHMMSEEVSAPVMQQNTPMDTTDTHIQHKEGVFDAIVHHGATQPDGSMVLENDDIWWIGKVFRQMDFVTNVESWISVRCLELGYTDFYIYRYYGFLVDVLDRTIEEIKALLARADLHADINRLYPNGVSYLQSKLSAYETSSAEAHEGVLSDLSPLPMDGVSVDDLKAKLGGMDLSTEKEYLGPAPDGFEMIDDPYASLDETTIQQEYAKIEAAGDLTPTAETESKKQDFRPNASADVKNTSQTPQNGVQRKMSFSFGSKIGSKPTDTDGATS